ncbi:unnamed protein product [Agarophyton chilense]
MTPHAIRPPSEQPPAVHSPPHPPLPRRRPAKPVGALPPKPASYGASSSSTRPTSSAPSPPAKPCGRRSPSWTPEEDTKLTTLVSKYISKPPSIIAPNTWSRVAHHLPNRTGKQCRERYLNQLRPGIRRDPWTMHEERILHQFHARLGNKWVAIARHLPGRTDNCVKNHWNSMLRKRQRRHAALKLTEKQVCHTLSRSNSSPLSPHSSSARQNTTPSCPQSATPSEMSSHLNDFASSGIPSPFTVSSPITPRRDTKLQISSLVATASATQTLVCNSLHTITTSHSHSDLRLHHNKSNSALSALTSFVPSPSTTTPETHIGSQLTTPSKTVTNTPQTNHQRVLSLHTPSQSTSRAKLSHTPVPFFFSPDKPPEHILYTQEIETDSGGTSPPIPLLDRPELHSGDNILRTCQRKPIAKKPPSRHVPTNALAALAAAASSIPLSPPRP